eukprot:EG_transcript_22361
MPSSHCQFMFCLLAHAAVLLLWSRHPRRWPGIALLALLALAVAYSRVHLEYHTWGQAFVGCATGSVVGLLGGVVVPRIEQQFGSQLAVAWRVLDWALGAQRPVEERRRR